MAILHIDPASPWYVRDAAGAILVAHISGGSVGILSGATALLARKGEGLHRLAGNAFFVSMLIMSAIGAAVAPFLRDRPSTVAGVLTFYLVATGWMTVRRNTGKIGRVEVGGFLVALGVGAAGLFFILQARNSPTGTIDGDPPQAFFVFLIVGMIAAASDLKVILRRGIFGAQRIARHLWRLGTALIIASGSLFLGQPKVFPASIRHSPVMFLPVLVPLALLFFWMIRVRLTGWFKAGALVRGAAA